MDNEILELLTSKLEDRKKNLIEFLAQGSAKEFAEYKSLCGEIRGLTVAQEEAKDLVRRLKELDNE